MDKDLVVLKSEELKTGELQSEIEVIKQRNEDQQERLMDLQNRIQELYMKAGETSIIAFPGEVADEAFAQGEHSVISTYEDLYAQAHQFLIDRELDVESIDFDSFLSDTDMAVIVDDLDKTVPREDRWKKSDLVVVFIAAFVGGLTDGILGDRNNKFTARGSKFSEWLNEFHEKKWKHKSGAPIDYQGSTEGLSFGGAYHRELSPGHDLLRFVEGIKAFKEGKFEAKGIRDGVEIVVSVTENQYGTPYGSMTLGAAIIEYCHHMLADLMSNNSLPFPGSSFLRECDNRKIRKLSADMYRQGFNLKNVFVQAASTIAIEIIIRVYFSVLSVQKYDASVEIAEDYSNWEAINQFVKPANKEKLHEMLMVAHTIVTAINLGKIVITKNISTINVTEIAAVVRYGIKVLKAVANRNRDYEKLIYHSSEIQERWEQVVNEVGFNDEILISEMSEKLVIA